MNARNFHVHAGGSGTAVTSPWRNVRVPVRVMRNLAPHLGSGHAISVSVVIQREVFPAQLEPVAGAVAAHHRPIGGHDFDAQIVELEGVVAIAHVAPRR